MHRLRELIYPTYFLQLISIIAQKSQIPRECRAVAAYVDDTFWLHLEDGLEQHFIAAFAWRVDYDHVCVDTVFLVFSRQDFFCFSDEEFHVFNIVDLCIVPAEMPDQVRERMVSQSKRFMRDCGYRGILAIEYFVKGDEVYFNEMAPRPHNSGHWTIEGSTTNQFRELCRYLLDMPLEEPQLKAPTVMKNILGQDLERAEALARENRPGVYVHIYGKTVSKPKRKMGHVTFVGVTGEEYAAKWADRFVK